MSNKPEWVKEGNLYRASLGPVTLVLVDSLLSGYTFSTIPAIFRERRLSLGTLKAAQRESVEIVEKFCRDVADWRRTAVKEALSAAVKDYRSMYPADPDLSGFREELDREQ